MGKIEQEIEKLKDKIAKHGNFSDKEMGHIISINNDVMRADGIAEGWAYVLDSSEYLEISIDIFNNSKSFFAKPKHE
jgi:hypothetical protein